MAGRVPPHLGTVQPKPVAPCQESVTLGPKPYFETRVRGYYAIHYVSS